ncbi:MULTISPECIES: hypothetical protein [Aeromonas]|uniref:hypothetical protein n=1 Tax=Aeromonas TaxID=642 RepID=UPI0005B2F323|nr:MULTISPECIES: hypothetical protein [Aeromonas]TNH69846.1 hypothetical protein CF142_14155 [Aeromonas caviae]
MERVINLLNTSVTDAKSSLDCIIEQNPKQAQQEAQLAIDFINNQGSAEHHKSRLAMLTTIVNKARKRLKQ